jgi:hypothetical protein
MCVSYLYLLYKSTLFYIISKIFFGVPHLATCIFYFLYNEPELGVIIDPDMALTPLPSSIGQVSNPQPSDREPSSLVTVHSLRACLGLPWKHKAIFLSNYCYIFLL